MLVEQAFNCLSVWFVFLVDVQPSLMAVFACSTFCASVWSGSGQRVLLVCEKTFLVVPPFSNSASSLCELPFFVARFPWNLFPIVQGFPLRSLFVGFPPVWFPSNYHPFSALGRCFVPGCLFQVRFRGRDSSPLFGLVGAKELLPCGGLIPILRTARSP